MKPLLFIVPLTALLAGSLVYCVLAIVAAFRYRVTHVQLRQDLPPVSVLRPLSGGDDDTEANLISVFEQQYGGFEILLAVEDESDPATAIAHKVMARYPHVSSRLIVSGPSPIPNPKVWKLRRLMGEARYTAIVMVDSDIHWEPDCLATVISELSLPNVALVTCPYRATCGPSLWSRIECLGLNVDFIAGVVTARMLNGMDFAVGCTIATWRADLDAIGGLEHLSRYVSEDFMMGQLMHKRGRLVVLSKSVIGHFIGTQSFLESWRHRLRWARGSRRSRRAGYLGEVFMKPVPIALVLWGITPGIPWLLLLAIVVRYVVAWNMAIRILDDPLFRRHWWLLPIEDLSSFATWILGFFGNTVSWRGTRIVAAKDGTAQGFVEGE